MCACGGGGDSRGQNKKFNGSAFHEKCVKASLSCDSEFQNRFQWMWRCGLMRLRRKLMNFFHGFRDACQLHEMSSPKPQRS